MIDARLPDIGSGGVLRVLQTLAIGLNDFKILSKNYEIYWLVFENQKWYSNIIDEEKIIVTKYLGSALNIEKYQNFLKYIPMNLRSFISILQRTKNIEEIITKYDIDLIHCPYQNGFISPRIPSIYHPHDLQHIYYPKNFTVIQRLMRNFIWKRNAKNARMIIVESKSVEWDLLNYWKIDRAKINIIITPPQEIKIKDKCVIKKKKSTMYIYPAAYWKHKNHEVLIKAFVKVLDEGTDVKLILFGALTPYSLKLLKLIPEKYSSKIILKGHISDYEVEKMYSEADVVVIPSLFESVSLPAWEAMLRGKPLLVADTSILREQIGDGALYFDPNNVNSLSRSILKTNGNKNIFEKKIQKNFLRVREITIEKFILKIIKLYDKI